jgi:uncharacterized protein (TIGR02466 family)
MIHNLFPTPIGFYELNREFTKSESDFLLNQKSRSNMGNTTSIDNYICRSSKLKKLKQFFDESLLHYFTTVYRPKYDVIPRITQSWVNYTKPGEYHHKHAHPNSFISGVFYIQSDAEKDKIYFYKDGYQQIKVPAADWNEWNSESWWFEAITGKLILFPSSLTHMVETVQAEQTRVSLSFNTFLSGYIGDENDLTGLRIGE